MAAVPPRTSLRSPLRVAARCARRWLIDDLSPLPRRCASRRCALLDEAPRCASGARCAIAPRSGRAAAACASGEGSCGSKRRRAADEKSLVVGRWRGVTDRAARTGAHCRTQALRFSARVTVPAA